MRRRSRSSNGRPSCCRSSPSCCRGSSRKFRKSSPAREGKPRKWRRRWKPRRRVIPPLRAALVTKGPPPPPPPERVKVTLGGFLAAETVWRQHNMVNDVGTAFATTPYPFSPLYNEKEFHGSARQSRISLPVESNIGPYQKLSGYCEMNVMGTDDT